MALAIFFESQSCRLLHVMKYYQPKQGTKKEEIPQNFNTVAFFDSPKLSEIGHFMILLLWKSAVWSRTKKQVVRGRYNLTR